MLSSKQLEEPKPQDHLLFWSEAKRNEDLYTLIEGGLHIQLETKSNNLLIGNCRKDVRKAVQSENGSAPLWMQLKCRFFLSKALKSICI